MLKTTIDLVRIELDSASEAARSGIAVFRIRPFLGQEFEVAVRVPDLLADGDVRGRAKAGLAKLLDHLRAELSA